MNTSRPISLLLCALGGEGGGVLSQWLVEAARIAGYPAQSTSIPGVAQRTGATTYYVEVFPQPLAELGGRRPVLSLNPVPGALDALVSSELLETTRQIGLGYASPDRTRVITSSARSFTTHERMQLADGRRDSAQLVDVVRRFGQEHHVLDMASMAQQAGTVVSAVMLGAIAGSGLLPFGRAHFEAAIGQGTQAAASLRGFALAYDAVNTPRQWAEVAAQVLPEGAASPLCPADQAALLDFPEPARAMLALGLARVIDYQNHAYGQVYLRRMRQVWQAELASDPGATNGWAVTREMARWVALWMAFDDIIRVADLKSRSTRLQRVVKEVRAGPDDLLKVYDHFKPGVPEFAALLPSAWADRLTAWDRGRVLRGREPWALPLKIGTHSVGGMLALRGLAGLKGWRVYGQRFAHEQLAIEGWLQAVVQGLARTWRLGHELAQCGQLIKGYGATNERGKLHLQHLVGHLAALPDPQAAAQAVAQARAAALQDDAGKALDLTLRAHGAPARPVAEQPIRFMRKPGASAPR
jgi:indolepyruvate ferredoxin oxidoreductase beta subunit